MFVYIIKVLFNFYECFGSSEMGGSGNGSDPKMRVRDLEYSLRITVIGGGMIIDTIDP